MLKAVIFDFDGVLVDSEQIHYRAFNRVLAPFGAQIPTQQYYDKFLGLTDEEVFRLVAKERKLALSDQQAAKLVEEKSSIFKELSRTEAVVIAGVTEFLKMLSDNKIPMAICSGALQPEIEMILAAAGLRSFFDVIISAEQVKKGKPHPEGFLLALTKLNEKSGRQIKANQCIVIEDSRWGLAAAKAAGMHTIAVTNTYTANQLNPAEKIVTKLTDLTIRDLQNLCP